jgi:oxygen-independent coproporphyrinogen-3 oxidase
MVLDRPTLPSEQEAAFMYCYAAGYLREKGYEHYEVSSYARKKDSDTKSPYRSCHNQIYWAVNGQWYAFGLGATSFVNGILIARPKSLFDYIRWVDALDSSKTSSHTTAPVLDALMDVVLKRLRTSEGLSLEWIRDEFGGVYVDAILRGGQLGVDLGFAKVDHDTQTIRLLDSRGFLYSNSIISSIFVELENAARRK